MLRFEGTLAQWFGERGYGYISPSDGGQRVFVHISAFPPDAPPPLQDERLSFEIVSNSAGRKQAAQVRRVQVRSPAPNPWLAPSPTRQRLRAKRRRMAWAAGTLAFILVSISLAWLHGPPSVRSDAGARWAHAADTRR